MIEAGVHFDHGTRKWNPKARELVDKAEHSVTMVGVCCIHLAGILPR